MRLRTLPFHGVSNLRDLGGYPTLDGRATRWGQLYRSDALHDMTSNDLVAFRVLGVKTVVDLRSVNEVLHSGRGLLASEPVRFLNASDFSGDGLEIRPATTMIDSDYLWRRYLAYLDNAAATFVRAIEELADESNYPIVVNCFFGKDRTGVLAALVLECLGVGQRVIVDDYVLSETYVPFILERLRHDERYRETIERTDPLLLEAQASTMVRFLDELDERYGGARAWALRAGVSERNLETLKDLLLD